MANRTLPLEITSLERHIDTELLDAPKLIPTSESANSVLLHTFIARKLRWYIENNYLGGQLWESYQDDFEDWTIEMFKECEKEVMHCLRDTLARRGVYIPRKNDRRKISQKLFDILSENELHKWTREDIQTQIEYGGGFIGNYKPFSPQILVVPTQADKGTKAETYQTYPGENIAIRQGTNNMNTQSDQYQQNQEQWAPNPESEFFASKIGQASKINDNQDPPNNFVKQLTDLGKLYFDKDTKYSGERYDILSNKLTIFKDYCRKVGLSKDQYHNAFSSMLRGNALNFYYEKIAEKGYNFENMIEKVRNQFETDEIKMEYLSQWRCTTLASIKNKHPEKKISECFHIMVSDLQKIQRGLEGSYQMNQNIRDQVLNGCQGIPECKMALYSPAPTFEGVVAQIRNALYTEEQSLMNPPFSTLYNESNGIEQHYTERKYKIGQDKESSHWKTKSDGREYGSSSRSQSGNAGPNRLKKCFVCNNPGCWSTKHSPKERKDAFSKFSRRPYFQNRPATIAKYQAFLAEWEGVEGMTEYDHDEVDQLLIDLEGGENNDNFSIYEFNHRNEYFFTDFGPVNPHELVSYLADQSAFHIITGKDIFKNYESSSQPNNPMKKLDSECEKEKSILPRYSSTKFYGILPDTGAAGVSTAGKPQVIALQRIDSSIKIDEKRAGEHRIRFGKGEATSLGTINVGTPVGVIMFHVVPTYTPFLFCLQDMKKMGVYLDNLQNVLVQGKKLIPIVMKFGHPWMLLNGIEKSIAYCNLTEPELKQLHRRFGHPSVSRLIKILNRAGHDVKNQIVEKITQYCHQCQVHGKSPGRFKFRIPKEYDFNHTVIVDIFNLDGHNVIHTIDESTSYQAAKFLSNMSASCVWNSFRSCWIDVYLGPPDFLVHDAGTNFASKEFRQNARSMGIQLNEVPVEAHNSIGKVERYHSILRRAYHIICDELRGQNVPREIILQMSVKALNDSVGPHGLIPTLLVYGAYPRMTKDSAPSPSITARAEAIEKAMKEIAKIRAERSVKDALATRNGPNTSNIMNLPLNSEVLVWRENKKWNGPFRLIAFDPLHQECVVQLPHGPTKFRSTVVKPFKTDQDNNEIPCEYVDVESDGELTTSEDTLNDEYSPPNAIEKSDKKGRGRPKGSKNLPKSRAISMEQTLLYDNYLSSKEEEDLKLSLKLRKDGIINTPGNPFETADQAEFESLIRNGVIELEKFDQIKHGNVRLFNARLVHEIKGKGTDLPYEKSRMVIAAWEDQGKAEILTQSPTLQRASQRLIITIAPSLLALAKTSENRITSSHTKMGVWLRDISQAYTQSTSMLNRLFYARIPKQFRNSFPEDTIIKVIKPLYGIPEAGTHWWVTYMDHHRKELEMVTSTYDPCLLTTKGEIFGVVGIQTDDTLILGEEKFSEKEEQKLKFSAKPKKKLSIDMPLHFNGCIISLNYDNSIDINQRDQGKKIEIVDFKINDSPATNTNEINNQKIKDIYVQQRARGAYIASICQPEACYDLSVAAQVQNPSREDITKLNKRLLWQKVNLQRGLKNVPLNLRSAKLFIFVDGSFANNLDFSSQVGYVIVLANETSQEDYTFSITGNIVHYSSTKSKRVTRSVLASEIYGMVAGVDMGYAINTTINLILNNLGIPTIPTIVCTDSYSLYECLVKLGTTKEKRLMIDIMALRQSYERRELYEIRWINGLDNPADAMTKINPNKALETLINCNTLEIKVEGWVKRDENPNYTD